MVRIVDEMFAFRGNVRPRFRVHFTGSDGAPTERSFGSRAAARAFADRHVLDHNRAVIQSIVGERKSPITVNGVDL